MFTSKSQKNDKNITFVQKLETSQTFFMIICYPCPERNPVKKRAHSSPFKAVPLLVILALVYHPALDTGQQSLQNQEKPSSSAFNLALCISTTLAFLLLLKYIKYALGLLQLFFCDQNDPSVVQLAPLLSHLLHVSTQIPLYKIFPTTLNNTSFSQFSVLFYCFSQHIIWYNDGQW